MRPIYKNFPPKELTDFSKYLDTLSIEDKPPNTFTALKNTENVNLAVQFSIAEEQGFICCYCMNRLKIYCDSYQRTRVKIELEHYQPKSIFDGTINSPNKSNLLCDGKEKSREDLRIEYKNLLGACGADGHCGNAKGDWELCFIPNPAVVKAKQFPRIGYNLKGEIRSVALDEEAKNNINEELKNKLKLNHTQLKSNRINTWRGVKREIKKQSKIQNLHQGGTREIQIVKDLIKRYSNRNKRN